MLKNSILIYSGGLDSTTLLYKNKDRIKLALYFKYSRQSKQEITTVKYFCTLLKIPLKIINVENIFKDFNTVLIGNKKIARNTNKALVPYRNGVFISIATAIAENFKIQNVLLGVIKSDGIYKDTTVKFIDNANRASTSGTNNRVKIKAPFAKYYKEDVISLAKKLNVPIDKTYSCFTGNKIPCGTCSACRIRSKYL